MKKRFWLAVLFLMMLCGTRVTVKAGSDGMLDLGSSPEIMINGGNLVSDENGKLYAADEAGGIYCYEGETPVLVCTDRASGLNLLGKDLYYVVSGAQGDIVRKRNLDTGASEEIYRADAKIEQMYAASGGTLYYLSEGRIYSWSPAGETPVQAEGIFGVRSFIPVADGYLYSKGKLPEAELYYNGTLLFQKVSNFYLADGYVIFVSKGETYQAKLSDLENAENPADKVSRYDETMFTVPREISAEDAEIRSCVSDSEETDTENPVSVLSTDAVSGFGSASVRQQNMAKRTRQMLEVRWTPLKDITGWDGAYIFKKGTEYSGIPYGQPIDGIYVPWGTTLSGFVTAVNTADSKMYTAYSDYGTSIAPYYSCDCSSFVSWAWNLTGRKTTRSLPTYSDQVVSQSIYSAQIGDSFIWYGSHAVIVSDIGYDSDGKIVYIDIAESTPPKTKVTRYGEGGTAALADLQNNYLQKEYILYRLKSQYSVTYTHDCAAPIDDSCEKCAGSKLPAPEFLTAERPESHSLQFSWKPVEKANAYGILRAEEENGNYSWISVSWETSFTDKDLETGKSYYYKVFPMQYVNSEWVDGTASRVLKLALLDTPDDLKLVSEKPEELRVSWSPVANVQVYGVLRAETRGGTYSWLGVTCDTEYTDTERVPGKEYYYKVYAAYNTGIGWLNSPYSEPLAGAAKFPAVENLKASYGAGERAIRISWDPMERASVYGVLRAEEPDGKYQWITAAGGTSYTDKNLDGKTYYYKVYASVSVNGNWFNGVSSEWAAGTVLAAPENVRVSGAGGTGLRVSWEPVEGAFAYRVYMADVNGGTLKEAAVVNNNEYVCSGLSEGTAKYFVIQSICETGDGLGYGSRSGYVKGTVAIGPPGAVRTGPGAGDHAVKLSWDRVNKADIYGILRAESEEGTYKWVSAVSGLAYTDAGLDGEKTYYYKVYAARYINGEWNNGEASEPVSGHVCAGAENFSAEAVKGNSVKLTWERVPEASCYAVFRNDGQSVTVLDIVNGTEYLDSGLSFGRKYTYTVRSMAYVDNAWGYGAYSDSASVKLEVGIPTALSAVRDEASGVVNLSWKEAAGAAMYGILRAEHADGPYNWMGVSLSASFEDAGCEPGKNYYYKVYGTVSVDGIWYNGNASEVVSVETPREKASGVDVSRYNGDIDWKRAASEGGISFAMVRIGYRRNADGVIIEDPYAKQNIEGALAAGLDVGVYFFSTAVNEAEALEEAAWTFDYIKNYSITFPVAYDCEGYASETSRMYLAGLTKEQRSQHAALFLDKVAEQGYVPMFYGSKYHLINDWDIVSLEEKYEIWVAQWPSVVPVYPDEGESSYGRIHKMWQYTESGTVPGIPGKVDMNVFYY